MDERESAIASFAQREEPGSGSRPPKAIDAMRAVSKIGFTDRDILRDTFSADAGQDTGREAGARRLF